VDHGDLRIRNLTYELFVELGRAPSAEEASLAAGEDVRESWRRLHEAHALVLDDAGEIRMANPFSAVPTSYRVQAAGRWWYGNCAWDAFGICAALGADGRIETSCPDCGEELVVEVRDRRPRNMSLVFHCLVPASHWWDDIVYT
jgi:hypothetical protein